MVVRPQRFGSGGMLMGCLGVLAAEEIIGVFHRILVRAREAERGMVV